MQVLSKTMMLIALIILLLGACELEPGSGVNAGAYTDTDTDTDTDCDGSSQDVTIDGDYDVRGVNADVGIAGLENIECITGFLQISDAMLDSLVGLESLKIIAGGLRIEDNAALTSLTSVGGDLYISSNNILPQFIVDEFAAGVAVAGTITITPNGEDCGSSGGICSTVAVGAEKEDAPSIVTILIKLLAALLGLL
jgi:hypothetical protein